MTDERPSCYFEAGYAEGLPRPVIYVASKQSVVKPGTNTKIHFDIHMNVNFFVNHNELRDKLKDAIEKNRMVLLPGPLEGVELGEECFSSDGASTRLSRDGPEPRPSRLPPPTR